MIRRERSLDGQAEVRCRTARSHPRSSGDDPAVTAPPEDRRPAPTKKTHQQQLWKPPSLGKRLYPPTLCGSCWWLPGASIPRTPRPSVHSLPAMSLYGMMAAQSMLPECRSSLPIRFSTLASGSLLADGESWRRTTLEVL
jgi:hypothetical protein